MSRARATAADKGRAGTAPSVRYLKVRAIVLGAGVLSLFGVVLGRAAQVQLLDAARLSRKARMQTRREVELQPRRGLITDRRGEPLAVTQDVDSVMVDPSAFQSDAERAQAADQLAKALRLERKKVAERLSKQGHFVWLKRRVDAATAQRVRELGIEAVDLLQEPKRFYPQKELAGHVLGFAGESAGLEGVERELDPMLRGQAVTVEAMRDARGKTVFLQGAPDPTRLTGATVTLTLDGAIQLAAEREVQKAVEGASAAAGWAMVMDVQTGAMLAMASAPAFDANKPGRDPEVWRNRGVQDALEPGSTIKSFVFAWAIEKGITTPDATLFCENGAWRRGRRTIHDTHKIGTVTVTEALRQSSNICAAKIGEALGARELMAGLRAFGFGERTSVGLPGEARGQMRDPARMKPIEVDTTAFGQGMSATGLQTVAAMAAIANGGVLLRPYLVEKVVAPDGKVLLERGRKEVRRVLRPETARRVTAMLEEVTRKGGTGTKAAIADFRVAGKTGTAQKVDFVNGGYGKKRLASFLGFVPAEAPRLAILVAVDEPEKGSVYGGDIAAPAWSAIAAEALRQLDVHPEKVREPALLVSTVAPSPEPSAGSPEPDEAPAEAPAGKSIVPDVTGLPARSAIRRIADSELEPELRGSGLAVAQSPRAGAIVRRGARVRITLEPPG
jgi:cell division protein FtsI (penicillin-binding protein 3)